MKLRVGLEILKFFKLKEREVLVTCTIIAVSQPPQISASLKTSNKWRFS